mgnify:CR=1 FL=1
MDPQTISFLNLLNNPSYGVLFLAFMIWSLLWKGIGLWKAAHNDQRNWFVAMLVLKTLGILEIVYIFYFSKPKNLLHSDIHKENGLK